MPTSKKDDNQVRRRPPATTLEAREDQLISAAVDLAEKQIREGTASSQVISHFLKLGSTYAQLEKEKLRKENELLRAKTESIKSQKDQDQLYKKALDAMRSYSGNGGSDQDDYDSDL